MKPAWTKRRAKEMSKGERRAGGLLPAVCLTQGGARQLGSLVGRGKTGNGRAGMQLTDPGPAPQTAGPLVAGELKATT